MKFLATVLFVGVLCAQLQPNPVVEGLKDGIRMREIRERTRRTEAETQQIQMETERLRLLNQRLARQLSDLEAKERAKSKTENDSADRAFTTAISTLRALYPDFDTYFEQSKKVSKIFRADASDPEFTVTNYLEGLYVIAKYASFAKPPLTSVERFLEQQLLAPPPAPK